LHLACDPLRQRFRHADELAVTSKRICVQVEGVHHLRIRLLQCLTARGDLLEQLDLAALVRFHIIGVDGSSLVGGIDAGTAGLQPDVAGGFELARVKQAPCFLSFLFLRKWLAVAAMQALPAFLECRTRVFVGLVFVRERRPPSFRHHSLPLSMYASASRSKSLRESSERNGATNAIT